MRCGMVQLVLGTLVLLPARAAAQGVPSDYHSVASAFSRQVIEAHGLTVSRMDLGRMEFDTNRFTALVRNTGDFPRVLGLSLRTAPGLWIRAAWQRGYRF